MATGYTHDIREGKLTEFKDFALQCARAVGACIHQRDDDASDLPKKREISDHHLKELINTEKEHQHFLSLTDEEILRMGKVQYENECKDRIKRQAQRQVYKERYLNMLESVDNWTPPSDDHLDYKEFMIRQLTDSLEWDCKDRDDTLPVPREDVEELKKEEMERYRWSYKYHTEGYQKECESVKRQNKWIDDLYESVNE